MATLDDTQVAVAVATAVTVALLEQDCGDGLSYGLSSNEDDRYAMC